MARRWPRPSLLCAPRGSVRALATTPSPSREPRGRICASSGENRGRASGTVATSHLQRSVAISSRAAGGARQWAAPEDWLTPVRASCQLGGRSPAPSFLGVINGELPAAVPGAPVPGRPSVPPTEAAAGQAKWTGRGRTPASPPPLTVPAPVSSSEASPMPGDPHGISLVWGPRHPSGLVKTSAGRAGPGRGAW